MTNAPEKDEDGKVVSSSGQDRTSMVDDPGVATPPPQTLDAEAMRQREERLRTGTPAPEILASLGDPEATQQEAEDAENTGDAGDEGEPDEEEPK